MHILHLDSHNFTGKLQHPEADEIHLWTYKTDSPKLLREESHAFLSRLLCAYTGIPETELVFGKGTHGKPYLKTGAESPTLHFNLSHAGTCAVIAFCTASPVGVDVEHTARRISLEKVAEKMFHNGETEVLKRLPEEEKAEWFFRCWTRAEAFLKGIGTGLSTSLGSKEAQKEMSEWTLETFLLTDNYICSIAYRNS